MKDIWKNRTNNLEKIASIVDNFKFTLMHSGFADVGSSISGHEFKKNLKKLQKTEVPLIGNIFTIEETTFDSIKYSGIVISTSPLKILSKEYGAYTLRSPQYLMNEYSTFLSGEKTPIKINFYDIQ